MSKDITNYVNSSKISLIPNIQKNGPSIAQAWPKDIAHKVDWCFMLFISFDDSNDQQTQLNFLSCNIKHQLIVAYNTSSKGTSSITDQIKQKL